MAAVAVLVVAAVVAAAVVAVNYLLEQQEPAELEVRQGNHGRTMEVLVQA